LWRSGDGLFFEVPPLASDALLTKLRLLIENINGVITFQMVLVLEMEFYLGLHARFEIFTVMKFQVAVFSVVTSCSSAVGYQSFVGCCCLHLHPAERHDIVSSACIFMLNMKAARPSEMLVSYRNTAWRHKPEDLDLKVGTVHISGRVINTF
jgi:hypothetical protein